MYSTVRVSDLDVDINATHIISILSHKQVIASSIMQLSSAPLLYKL